MPSAIAARPSRPAVPAPDARPPAEQFSLAVWVTTFLGVTVPFAGVVAAAVLAWGHGFGAVDLGLLVGGYLLTALGVTVGYHRLFTHRSFKAAWPVQAALGVFGSMAVQGRLLEWVGRHRRHHQHSDRPGDPHSPHGHGPGGWGVARGFWHAHIGWAFAPDPTGLERYAQDLAKSRLLRAVNRLFPLWVALGLLVPAVVGGLAAGSWLGAASGFLWGGLVRVFLLHHVTWSVNSVCHLWGRRPYPCPDESRNNWLFGLLALGEGWHNNHHADPTSARHGFRWWQVDPSYWVIRGLAAVGLVWDVKPPRVAGTDGGSR